MDSCKSTHFASLAQTDNEAASVQRNANRVTLDYIVDNIIGHMEYYHPKASPQMTIAIVTCANGFVVVGKAAPADPENFNPELGRKFAMEDAIRQIWPLEAYLLCEKLNGKKYAPEKI